MKTNRTARQIVKSYMVLVWVAVAMVAGFELWALCHWQPDSAYVASQQAAMSQLGNVEVNFSRIGFVTH